MKPCSIAILLAFIFISVAVRAQTTTFTYQGQLNTNNAPANGQYDFQFQLVNVNNNPVSAPLTNAPVTVTNGFFTTTLDFGSAVFNGSNYWIQLGVRNFGSTGAYTILSPPQPITSVPYAIRAINAANASNAMFLTVPLQTTNLAGTISFSNLPSNVAFLNSNETFSSVLNFSGAATLTNPANTFIGNGFGLTSLNATNLTGIVADTHLSTNVALQSDTVLNFAGSVGSTNFIGAGHGLTNVPGAFFWVTVSGSSAPANPNVGYICTNNTTPVTITLPASPSVGDTYKVAGIGDAGWIIAQNANQQIFAGNLSSSVGQSWTASFGVANWTAITCSADGTKMAAGYNINGTSGGYIYTSTNSGATWSSQNFSSGAAYWSAIASSADGTHLIAAAGYSPYLSQTGDVYISSTSGATWAAVVGSAAWSCVAISADGTKMAAAVRGGTVYTNYGLGWNAVGGTTYEWNAIAMSSDGTKLVGAEGNGEILTSTNSGATWMGRINVTSGANPDAVACSSDGSRMIVTTGNGEIYLSTDFGVTWIQQNSPVSGDLTAVASSADGSRLMVTVGGGAAGSIYGSSNSGGTWSQLAGSPSAKWSGIDSSADGSTLAAAVYNGDIYVSSQSSTTSGLTGYLTGGQHSAIDLLYVGNGQFLPLSSEGTIRAY
ncbi:MAG TPA: hypothetical protein VGI03_16470 [Verrucomicrobiae bacterium]